MPSPHSEIRPTRLLSPDWLRTGVNPKAGPTALGVLEVRGNVDGTAEGQRYDGAGTGNRQQSPANAIVPDNQ